MSSKCQGEAQLRSPMETSETRPIWNRRLLHGTRADCVSSGSIVIAQVAVPLEQGITAHASQNSETPGVSPTTMRNGVPHRGSWPRSGGVDPAGPPGVRARDAAPPSHARERRAGHFAHELQRLPLWSRLFFVGRKPRHLGDDARLRPRGRPRPGLPSP